jgi:hypothetical protein
MCGCVSVCVYACGATSFMCGCVGHRRLPFYFSDTLAITLIHTLTLTPSRLLSVAFVVVAVCIVAVTITSPGHASVYVPRSLSMPVRCGAMCPRSGITFFLSQQQHQQQLLLPLTMYILFYFLRYPVSLQRLRRYVNRVLQCRRWFFLFWRELNTLQCF